jgi:hypothetical protein
MKRGEELLSLAYCRPLPLQHDAINAHRLGDVLQPLLPQRFVLQRQFVFDLIVHRAGDENAARLRYALDAHRNIDAIPVQLLAILAHFTHMNPHAKCDTLLSRQRHIACVYLALYLDGALHRTADTREFRQQAIATRADGMAAVLPHPLNHHVERGSEDTQGRHVVGFDAAAVALHIGMEHDGQAAGDDVRFHTSDSRAGDSAWNLHSCSIMTTLLTTPLLLANPSVNQP